MSESKESLLDLLDPDEPFSFGVCWSCGKEISKTTKTCGECALKIVDFAKFWNDFMKAPYDPREVQKEDAENMPLSLKEIYEADNEPLYFYCTVGHWRLNGWHIVKAVNYDGVTFKDIQLDNNEEHIESLFNYGITWVAYRQKPEVVE